MTDRLLELRRTVRERAPLIHCITNHITIGDCANAVLAVGAKPIMAEHPAETAGITRGADALALNLGNITDLRMESMGLSARAARERGIPIVLDLVGVGCSALRLDFAGELVNRFHPDLIKGNLAEVDALAQGRTLARGVDARAGDLRESPAKIAAKAQPLAAALSCAVAVTGPVDVISLPGESWAVRGGHPMLGEMTGTGCMLGVLIAAFSACGPVGEAALLATALVGAAGELAAEEARGIGTFRAALFDGLYGLADDALAARTCIAEILNNLDYMERIADNG